VTRLSRTTYLSLAKIPTTFKAPDIISKLPPSQHFQLFNLRSQLYPTLAVRHVIFPDWHSFQWHAFWMPIRFMSSMTSYQEWTPEFRIVIGRSEQPLYSALYSGRVREQRLVLFEIQFWVRFYEKFANGSNEKTHGRWMCIGVSKKDNMKKCNQEANCVDGNWFRWFRISIGGVTWTLCPAFRSYEISIM
jgi:hypothetical protein